MMRSYGENGVIDHFYEENIEDVSLLEASGFGSSPSQWNFLF